MPDTDRAVAPDGLTPEQRRAFLADEPRVLVVGGPGTGKTAVALLKARRTVEELPADSVRRVLFLTFSRAATTELTKRAPGAVSGELGARIEIHTFHAFALNTLNAWRRFAGGPAEPVTLKTREEESLGLGASGSMRFDDLIPAVVQLFADAPWLLEAYRDRYAAIICDEFQDTNTASARLLDLLAERAQLVCLADPDQMIYDWTDPSMPNRLSDFLASGARRYDLGYDSRRDPSNIIPRAADAIRRRQFGDTAIAAACAQDRLRVLSYGLGDEPFDLIVAWIRAALDRGGEQVGVFFARNATVNDFAERLRDEGIEHEIAGLDGAIGEAQRAAAAAARWAAGLGGWEDFLRALGLFVASCYRGKNPPPLASALVDDLDALPEGLWPRLEEEREQLAIAARESTGDFLARLTSLWSRLFRGRPRTLWESGVRSLAGQTLALRRRPLDEQLAAVIERIAEESRSAYLIDTVRSWSAPVRIMNVYQVKGREMDEVLLAHLADDYDEWSRSGMARLARVHYVALSRARQRARILLPPTPKSFFAPYATLCAPAAF